MAGAQFQSKSRGFILKTFECRQRRMHYMRRPRYGKGRLLGLISETGVFFSFNKSLAARERLGYLSRPFH